MKQRQKLLGYYNYTVILTYIGMLIGFLGITLSVEGSFFKSVLCLMAAGVCDMFDGTVAATKARTQQEKCFGIQIDSLSDLICFGVLPAMIVYSRNRRNHVILIVCALYLLCALIRLAFFNVDEQERQQNSDGAREIYHGLPVTLSALFLPLSCGAASLLSRRGAVIPTASLFVMSILFLSPFSVKKPKLIGKLCVLLCGAVAFGLVILTCNSL